MSENNTLWNNPMVEKALKSLSPEEIEKFKKIGESMYGNIDFKDSKILNNIAPPIAEAVAYVEEGLKAGLHPSDLDENEIHCMVNAYGDDWYKKYGYTREEVPEPGLSLQTKAKLNEIIEKKIKTMKR